jgi:outer membrane protein assembly factor BamB
MTLQKKTVVAALDAKTGKPVWVNRGTAQGLWSIVGSDEEAVAGTYASGTYYQAAPLLDQMIAFDADTGKIRWRFHTSGPVKMSPVLLNDRLYVGDTVGLLYTLDARNGRLLEIREFKQPFTTSPPIVAGQKLIVVNGTSVNAIRLSGRPDIPQRTGWGMTSAM